MSDTKMMYVYNTYDSIIDLVEGISTHHFEENKEKVIEKIRKFRDEIPTTKQVCREFGYNHKDQKGFTDFADFIESNPEIDVGSEDEKISPEDYSGF